MRKVWALVLLGVALAAPAIAAEGSAEAERGWSIGGGVGPITPLPTLEVRVVQGNIRVGKSVTLEAHLFRPQNVPVAGIPVKFYWEGYVGTSVTGADGYARISYVPSKAGLVQVKAEARSQNWFRRDSTFVTVQR